MGLFERIFRRKNTGVDHVPLQMITSNTNYFHSFGQDLYQSDLVVSAIRPYAKHVGKLLAKHLQNENVNPNPMLRKALEEPNEFMTFQKMLEKAALTLKVNGNVFIYIQRENDEVTGFTLLQPSTVEAVVSRYSEILYLKMHFNSGDIQAIPYEDVIHLRANFYENEIFADNPAQQLVHVMEQMTISEQGISHAIKNNFIIRWLLKFSGAMRPEDLTRETENIRREFLNQDSGGVVGVDSKFDVQGVHSSQAMAYVPSEGIHNLFIKRIYNFFGVSEAIVNNTYTEEEFSAWYEAEIMPIAKELSDEFTRKLFSVRERAHGNRIIFDTSSLIFASNKTKLQLVALIDRGIMSEEEYREILNLGAKQEDHNFIIRREYMSADEMDMHRTLIDDMVDDRAIGGELDDERNLQSENDTGNEESDDI